MISIHPHTPIDKGVLFVRYEDMLVSPEKECRRILNYLKMQREASFIRNAIKNQSFSRKKREFPMKGKISKARFMRVGKSGQWKQRLSIQQKAIFVEQLSKELRNLSYKV